MPKHKGGDEISDPLTQEQAVKPLCYVLFQSLILSLFYNPYVQTHTTTLFHRALLPSTLQLNDVILWS